MHTAMVLEPSDRKLLRELQRDAGVSDDELGRRLGLDPSDVRQRRDALRAAGVVRREVALLDPTLLSPEVLVLALVGFTRDDAAWLRTFEQRMAADLAVLRCHRLVGEYEYALVIRVRDAAEYAQWSRDVLLADGNILHYSSFVMDATVKDEPQPPLAI